MAETEAKHHITLIGGGKFSTIGGIVKSVSEIANALAEQGDDVLILANGQKGDEPFYDLHPSVELRFINYPHNVTAIKRLKEILDPLETDLLVVAFSNRLGLNVMLAAIDVPYPVLRSEHGNPVYLTQTIWNNNPDVRQLTFDLADYSHVLMPEYRTFPVMPAETRSRARVIPSPIDTCVPTAKPHLSGEENKRIIYTGRLVSFEKEVDLLVDAFISIADKRKEWELHLYGDGSERGELEEMAANAKLLNTQIFFHGSVDGEELSRQYSGAHLFVIPSRTEGCPMSLGEAMAHGLPAIGYRDCAGVNEMIKHNRSGLLVNREEQDSREEQVENLARAMMRLSASRDMRRKFSKAARRRIRFYDSDLVLLAWCQYITECAQQGLSSDALRHNRDKKVQTMLDGLYNKIKKTNEIPTSDEDDWLSVHRKKLEPVARPPKEVDFEPMISVIVPTFNKQEFIKETINSIRQQDMRKLEIIVVNDGSEDKTASILDRMSTRDPRIRVFHRENQGVSKSRNFGLEQARGRYVLFWDGDDVLEKNACSELLRVALANQSDIVVSALYLFTRKAQWITPKYWLLQNFTGDNVHITKDRMLRYDVSCCNKLFRREFLTKNELAFPEDIRLEDIYFAWKAHLLAKKVSVAELQLGGYRKVFGKSAALSGSRTWSSLKVRSTIKVYALLQELIESKPNLTQADMKTDIDIYFLSVFEAAVDTSIQLLGNDKEAKQWLFSISAILKTYDPVIFDYLPSDQRHRMWAIRKLNKTVTKSAIERLLNQKEIPGQKCTHNVELSFERSVRLMESQPNSERIPRHAPALEVAEYFAKNALTLGTGRV